MMKWTIHELKRRAHADPTFDYVEDFTPFLQGTGDILAIAPVRVHGTYRMQNQDSEIWFDATVETSLTMSCAITLEDVEVPLSFQTDLHFAKTQIDDSVYLIEGITIDFSPVIWSEILIEKPMRVVKPGASLEPGEELPEDDGSDTKNPFSALKDDIQ
jgi:uncharacterized protein